MLVDRVDESEFTGGRNNPVDSFELIEPMVRSLTLLETPGIGFKFFLWDAIEPHFTEVSRPDRIGYRILRWENAKLKTLLQKRLMAYSNRNVRKLDSIADSVRPYDLDELSVIFANSSPRDLIRVCGKILAEQQQIDSNAGLLSADAIYKGIDEFCEALVGELFRSNSNYLNQLRRVGTHSKQIDFTIGHVSDIFKISLNAARARVDNWKGFGTVELGKVANNSPRGRQVKLYGINDVRLARVMTFQLSTGQFVNDKIKQCPNCKRYILRDWGESDSTNVCHYCGYDWDKSAISPDFVPPDEQDIFDDEPQQLQLNI